MQQPLVSILIPVKNTEAFLQECLDSICTQTYQNWEVLTINDSSTDRSREILEAYAKKDSRIKVHDNEGNGIIAALRTAYALSKGDFVTRMDSDDMMTPNKLQIMVSALLENGNGNIAVGQVKYFSDSGISDGYARYEKWLNQLTVKGTNYSEIYKECVIPSPCWMVYRSDLDSCGAFHPDTYPEDYDLAFRFYKNRLKCIPCGEVLHYWRDYDTRTSRTSVHYAQNYFLDIKLYYFLKLEYDTKRPLCVWGAGNKGKAIAKKLIKRDIDFHWLCDNVNKIGKDIYGKKMRSFMALSNMKNPQTIVTVANVEAQETIQKFFSKLLHSKGLDYFFFC